ncbi:MAG TPA: hypothetical protein GXZ24_08970 [Firmicutes bacterium]|nr:hypothetical protein [Bacillota bacterium]
MFFPQDVRKKSLEQRERSLLAIMLAVLCAMFVFMAVVPQSVIAETQIVDVLYDGTMVLAPSETFEVTAYNSGKTYIVGKNTPLGALQAAADANGFTYAVTDKNYDKSGALLLDDVGSYSYKPGSWYACVNDILKDGFNNSEGALNLIELMDGDRVEFYYSTVKGDLNAMKAAATAAVKVKVATGESGGDPGNTVALEIAGDGINNPLKLTKADLEEMKLSRYLYSTINTWPTKSWYVAEGVKLSELLAKAGIKDEAKLLKFTSKDGFKANFTVQELLKEERYLFPRFRENEEYSGHIPGSPDGAEKVEAILAFRSFDSDDFADMGDKNALHLTFGQRAQTEQTNAVFAKYVTKVEVLTSDPGQWDAPKATPAPGEVVAGTLVELSSSFNDTDKVHYTLDGSEPTVNSPMYNWVASRWSNRSDYKEINCPIDIKKDTTIKAVVIGPGKRNSDVVEFKYTVAEGSAVFGISGDVSADYSLGRLQALGKTTGEYRYTSGEKLITEQCTGVLLADVLASEGITDPAAKVTILTTDGYLHDSYEVTLKAVRDGNYLVTYQVNNESFEDISKDGKTTSQIRIYRNHDDGSGWLNRLTMISGVSVAGSAVSPGDWTLQLVGARNEAVTKDYFEQGLACRPTHRVTWTDEDGNEWGGVPLWLLVGMVDDDPDPNPTHYTFSDDLAAQGYSIKIIAGDGWDTSLESADIAHSDGYIVANTLNGKPLPEKTPGGKDCWPLHLKGEKIHSGQQVGNIERIELIGLPKKPEGWTLEMIGEVGDIITQDEFEEGLACVSSHKAQWTDNEDNVWSGVPLWVLLGAIDDAETKSHWTFNDNVAETGYTVKVTAKDGFSKTFNSVDVARNNNFIIASKINGAPLADKKSKPLRLVGAGVAKGDSSLSGSAVGNIVRIEIPELQTPPAGKGSWNLILKGRISDVLSQAEFEEALSCHKKEWTDGEGKVWSGVPLRLLAGWVDDRQPHKYDHDQALAGYKIFVKAADGYSKDLDSKDIAMANDSDYIIADKCDGQPLTGNSWPLRLVGAGVAKADGSLGGTSVGNLAEIELKDFGVLPSLPGVRIVKYAEDNKTILSEKTVDYKWMEENLPVIGDGKTIYRYEGITNNPDNIWGKDETYPGGFKIEDAVMGTRVRDLCDLVGGMGAGTEIVFVAKDGWENRFPYSSIYTDPIVQAHQGDAVLAWFANGNYVPEYRDGMRLFFMPEDCVYSQWDMHESLPEKYWHFKESDGIQYPSCAGLSPKYVTEIRVYSLPQGDWVLELDGKAIGGLEYDVSKTYFEQGLACTFGAEHKASYTDSQGRVWEGMPLWFLAGFVDDEDLHSRESFDEEKARAGYQVVITAADGHTVTIDSKNIIRNSDYIIANTLDGTVIPDDHSDWPLRLVGNAVTGKQSISRIVRIELVGSGERPVYDVTPKTDIAYTIGKTADGISTMTVKSGVSGMKYFAANVTPVVAHAGPETAVFTHLRNGVQLAISAVKADFDQAGVDLAQAGFNVQPGDVIKVYLVDDLNNLPDHSPIVLQ